MKRKVLVVDDNTHIRVLLNHILEEEYEVILAEDGMIALTKLQSGLRPDLIISDLQMPNISGIEFLQHLKASYLFQDIPVMVLSGREKSVDRLSSLRYGASDYLVKPFNPEELSIRVENLLKS